MLKKLMKLTGFMGICLTMMWTDPSEVMAGIEVETSTMLCAKIDAPNVVLRDYPGTSGKVISAAIQGEVYKVEENTGNGWVKIQNGSTEGYIRSGQATLFEKTREKVDESVLKRQKIVEYALQFLGGRYVFGGSDPYSGVDCSGFTRYVMQHGAGINLVHSSTGQSRQGREIEVEQAKAGDLIFYGGSNYIDHVGIYMGDGQIVHASTVKTGIKISALNYRNPVKAVSVIN